MNVGPARLPVPLHRPTGAVMAALASIVACSAAGPTARLPRAGLQRDPAGRPFYEIQRISTRVCHGASRAEAERLGRLRLAHDAQTRGYSGVRDPVCTETPVPDCPNDTRCSAIAVRYVRPDATGAVPDSVPGARCTPACAQGASCQDGQCVASCDPPCGADQLCVQDGTCQRVR